MFGVIVGGALTLFTQAWRQKKQFAYDREVREKQLAYDRELRQEQFTHEREQEIRGRRTAALAALQVLLDEQATALEDLWGFIENPDVRPHLRMSPADALKVLQGRSYRRHLWATHLSSSQAINEYAAKTADLLLLLKQQDFADLSVGDIPAIDEQLHDTAMSKFKAVAPFLATAQKEINDLMTLLNGISIEVR